MQNGTVPQSGSMPLDGLLRMLEETHLIISFDPQSGLLQTANDVALRLLGRQAAEIGGLHIAGQIATGSETFAQACKAAKTGTPAAVRCTLRTAGNGSTPIIGHLMPCADADAGEAMVLLAPIGAQNDPALLDLQGRANAIDRAQAVAAFDVDGHVIEANANFLALMGYTLDEVLGRPHGLFCDEGLVSSVAYKQFWDRLRAGSFIEDEFKRIAAGGREVWIRASYSPVVGEDGKVRKIVKYAMDVTATQLRAAETMGKVKAIERAQAMVEFDLDGKVLAANDMFLELTGYAAGDILGEHHRLFCDPIETQGLPYRQFWQRLGRGEFESGEYKRVGKNGKEIWLQATYNPILDPSGRVVKIVKFAIDVTRAKMQSVECESKLNAISRAQAIVEFNPKGEILHANALFLKLMDYSLEEIVGKHHRIFCDPAYTASEHYEHFWQKLRNGDVQGGAFKRFGKRGKEVWIQSTYNPILGLDGKTFKVVKYAYDVTEAKLHNAEFESKVNAINRSQAVIEFDLDGRVLRANPNFLRLLNYKSEDIVGKHHRIFCDPAYAKSEAYTTFWDKLRRGDFDSGEYRRIAGDGSDVWIQATYNPILDMEGRPVKIVKYAIDVTEMKQRNVEFESRLSAVDRGQAVIEFDLEGNILKVNEQFIRVIGYSRRELVGGHHSMLCDPTLIVSQAYRDFWLALGKGETFAGRFHRVGKFGREVHIQASYSPIFNLRGDVVRIIKYAFDITQQVALERHIAAKSSEFADVVADLSRSIEEIKRSTSSATLMSSQTQTNAEQGYDALNNAIQAIDLIQRSSTEIADIVTVISDIAGQTNLLAFNAAIEAARAGDHGVGFSVVAAEVRRLAERSSQAAQEIAKLINESVKRVNLGSDRSQHAKQAFEQIVGSVGRTGSSINEIATSAVSQQTVSRKVTRLIGELTAAAAS